MLQVGRRQPCAVECLHLLSSASHGWQWPYAAEEVIFGSWHGSPQSYCSHALQRHMKGYQVGYDVRYVFAMPAAISVESFIPACMQQLSEGRAVHRQALIRMSVPAWQPISLQPESSSYAGLRGVKLWGCRAAAGPQCHNGSLCSSHAAAHAAASAASLALAAGPAGGVGPPCGGHS